MKVKDLKELLKDCPDEFEVCVAFVESSGYQRGLCIGATRAFKGTAFPPEFLKIHNYRGNIIIQADVPPGTLDREEKAPDETSH